MTEMVRRVVERVRDDLDTRGWIVTPAVRRILDALVGDKPLGGPILDVLQTGRDPGLDIPVLVRFGALLAQSTADADKVPIMAELRDSWFADTQHMLRDDTLELFLLFAERTVEPFKI